MWRKSRETACWQRKKTKFLERTVGKFSTKNTKAITFGEEGGASISSILRLN